jgi:predicted dehydrogenase
MLKAKELIASGALGTLTDVEVKLNVFTPWHLWDFLAGIPRMEILYHSIHYIDLVRNLLGNPSSISARTIKHPAMSALASVRTNICMHYGEYLWANILTNHCHDFGDKHQHAYLKIEGTTGAIMIRIGLLLNYPHGEPDVFEYVSREPGHPYEWTTIPMEGTWFPHAFIGSMAEILRTVSEPDHMPDNHVNDCLHTMACVEAAYISSESEGIKPETLI